MVIGSANVGPPVAPVARKPASSNMPQNDASRGVMTPTQSSVATAIAHAASQDDPGGAKGPPRSKCPASERRSSNNPTPGTPCGNAEKSRCTISRLQRLRMPHLPALRVIGDDSLEGFAHAQKRTRRHRWVENRVLPRRATVAVKILSGSVQGHYLLSSWIHCWLDLTYHCQGSARRGTVGSVNF